MATVEQVLAEAVGLGEFNLTREFRRSHGFFAGPKEMRYVISLGSEGVDGRDERINLYYSPSGLLERESLSLRMTPVLESSDRGTMIWQEADLVRARMQSPDASHYSTGIVAIHRITEQAVTNLMVVALSNDKLPDRLHLLTSPDS